MMQHASLHHAAACVLYAAMGHGPWAMCMWIAVSETVSAHPRALARGHAGPHCIVLACHSCSRIMISQWDQYDLSDLSDSQGELTLPKESADDATAAQLDICETASEESHPAAPTFMLPLPALPQDLDQFDVDMAEAEPCPPEAPPEDDNHTDHHAAGLREACRTKACSMQFQLVT